MCCSIAWSTLRKMSVRYQLDASFSLLISFDIRCSFIETSILQHHVGHHERALTLLHPSMYQAKQCTKHLMGQQQA